jgi:hypothetical protein
MIGTREGAELAWTFRDRLRVALLARLGERMLLTRFEITPQGRAALADCDATKETEAPGT